MTRPRQPLRRGIGARAPVRPTYASWLNWIEAEFAAVRYFALNGTDHRTHADQDAAIGDYIRWRNHHAKPKSGFATDSKIRHPGYPFKAT